MSSSKKRKQPSGLVISSKTPWKSRAKKKIITKDELEKASKDLPRIEHPPELARLTKHFVSLSPSSVRISSHDPKRLRAKNYKSRNNITSWSKKSRANMVSRLLTLDYTPLFGTGNRPPAMITLTYPNDWETVVPNGSIFKSHIQAFLRRYEHDFGETFVGLWKMEFQRRGAPHLHILTSLPDAAWVIRDWASWAWADIVNHPEPAERVKHEAAGTRVDEWLDFPVFDAHLIAIYFSKHSSPNSNSAKEYQNRVPEIWKEAGQVGRFWGYWGLRPATVKVQLSQADAVFVKRTLRRWHRANSKPIRVKVPRVNSKNGVVKHRSVNRRAKRMSGTGGFVSVPDGIVMTEYLTRLLSNQKLETRLTKCEQEESAKDDAARLFRIQRWLNECRLVLLGWFRKAKGVFNWSRRIR